MDFTFLQYSTCDLLPICWPNSGLDSSSQFLSLPGSSTYPLLPSYWQFSFLLNLSEEAFLTRDTSLQIIPQHKELHPFMGWRGSRAGNSEDIVGYTHIYTYTAMWTCTHLVPFLFSQAPALTSWLSWQQKLNEFLLWFVIISQIEEHVIVFPYPY